MKKTISILLVMLVLSSLLSVPALATGEGNVDGSSGGMGREIRAKKRGE